MSGPRSLSRTEAPRILMLAHDPGGANAVAAVAGGLETRGFRLRLYGHGPALKRYELMGRPGMPLPDYLEESSISGMLDLLQTERPDLVISGTSGDDCHERHLWMAARQSGVPSIAILDQWINFGLRFSPYSLAERDTYLARPEHPYQPDYVMAMDEAAGQELLHDGIPAERVIISGQPYFDMLAARRESYSPADMIRLRAVLGIDAGEKVLVFISESIRQDYRVAEGQAPYWGYDEISIFEALIQGLRPLLAAGERIRLIVKQHPLERDNGYMKRLPELEKTHPGLKLEILQDIDPHDLILVADLVCGMSSMLLLEALIMQRPALSIQIGLSRENPLVLESRGIMKSIVRMEELMPALEAALQGRSHAIVDTAGAAIAGANTAGATATNNDATPTADAAAWHYQPGAVDKICDFVEGLLCRN